MGWTDERIELLRKLWQDGLSAGQIAKGLGGVTRNAVLGKIHRLGLSGRATPSAPTRVYKKPRAPKPITAAPSARPDSISAKHVKNHLDDSPGMATIITLDVHMCKWPIGDPARDNFTFCGRRSDGGPYCHEHSQVAYQPAQHKKMTASELARSLRRYI